MCHSDQKLHEHVQKGSKEGFWPVEREALVGGSYILVRESAVVKDNFCEVEQQSGSKVSRVASLFSPSGPIRRPALGFIPMAVLSSVVCCVP